MQVSAAPGQEALSVMDVPETVVRGVLSGFNNRAKAIANHIITGYTDSADAVVSSGKNVGTFVQKMNESAANFGTSTTDSMGQMLKTVNHGLSGLLGAF